MKKKVFWKEPLINILTFFGFLSLGFTLWFPIIFIYSQIEKLIWTDIIFITLYGFGAFFIAYKITEKVVEK